jgi:hypothetical protein
LGIFLQTDGSYGAGGLGNHVASLRRSAPFVESLYAANFKLRRSAPFVESMYAANFKLRRSAPSVEPLPH